MLFCIGPELANKLADLPLKVPYNSSLLQHCILTLAVVPNSGYKKSAKRTCRCGRPKLAFVTSCAAY